MERTVWDRYHDLMSRAIERQRAEGRTVRCPVCNAGIGKPCIGEIHSQRVEMARKSERGGYGT